MTTPIDPTTPPVAPADGAPVAPKPAETPAPEAKPEDSLPDWAKKERTDLRAEAANYRVKLREAQDALKLAKSPEEVAAAAAEFQTRISELEQSVLVNDVARKAGLPAEAAARLRGTTEAELTADAEALKKLLAPAAPESLSGGLDPSSKDDGEMDPRALARKTRRF